MLYKLFLSKKGFTMVEILIVVIILGVLTSVGIPLFGSVVKTQRQNDCRNQAVAIKGAFDQVMSGMIDTGKAQETKRDLDGNVLRPALDLSNPKIQGDHKTKYPAVEIFDEDGIGVNDDKYVGKDCFVLAESQKIPGKVAFTISDIRGGYRDVVNVPEYNDGCEVGNYLKKKHLADTAFYTILDNQEIPVCPFADLTDNDETNDYYYHILWDVESERTVVVCSCPYCNEAD